MTVRLALKYLRNLKEPTGHLARWALELQQWDFEIIHRKGKQFELPDALSRMFEDGDECIAGFTEIQDKSYLELMEKVRAKPSKYPNWRIENGMLYIRRYDKLLDPITNCEGHRKNL